ncbi:MAG: nitrous oxide reductase family maturation protein NosD, partial [Promethearchaeota archaeon]
YFVLIPNTSLMRNTEGQIIDRLAAEAPNHSILQDKSSNNSLYEPHSLISITSNSDFLNQAAAENWPGNGSATNPYIIKGLTISSDEEMRILIYIGGTDVHFRIENCLLSQGRNGIQLTGTKNGQLFNNIITNNIADGIFLQNAEYNMLSNNIVTNNQEAGIALQDSEENILSNNTITKNRLRGIGLGNSENNILSNNKVISNGDSGIILGGSQNNFLWGNILTNNDHNGIRVTYSDNCYVLNNTVTKNSGNGVNLYESSTCQMIGNTLANNSNYGLRLSTSGNNSIQFNNFQENTVEDRGWNNSFKQNYWSDWTNPDSNGDGIVDQPYPVDEGNFDLYPLVDPFPHEPILLDQHLVNIFINPSRGELLFRTVTIRWGILDLGGHEISYTVSYSANGGMDWTIITTGLTTPYYIWKIPLNLNGTQYLAKVNASCINGASCEIISEMLSISNTHMQPFRILLPMGGEIYSRRIIIQWTSVVDVFNHEVSYTVSFSADNGTSWNILALNVVSTILSWDSTTVIDGSQYLIQVNASCTEGVRRVRRSNSTFTINNPHNIQPFTVLAPMGGETYSGIVTIQWTQATDPFDHVVCYTISYSIDNGTQPFSSLSWDTLTSNLLLTTFEWNSTTVVDGSQYLIQVNASCEGGMWRVATSTTFTIKNNPQRSNYPMTQMSTPLMGTKGSLNLQSILQILSPIVVLSFLVTMVIIIRRQQLG